jgi:hypothetical protein
MWFTAFRFEPTRKGKEVARRECGLLLQFHIREMHSRWAGGLSAGGGL